MAATTKPKGTSLDPLTKQLRSLLAHPPTEFRPQPVWSLNSLLTRERLTEMLEQFREQGMGGVFVLPRYGLVTGFLMDEWFEMWAHVVRECKRLGMECQIYDEFMCPSGCAGGHALADAPHTMARFLETTSHTRPTRSAEGAVAAFVPERGFDHPRRVSGSELRDALQEASPERPVMTLAYAPAPPEAGMGGLPYADLTRHDATASFLRAGYEPYARRFAKEFGRTIRYVFTDEPSLAQSPRGFLWSELLSREFHKDNGYRLEDRLETFCFGGDGATASRFDYFATLNRLFCVNYARQIYDWCEAHGILFTGHYNEHNWLNPADTPDTMAMLRWMHAPGNDYLAFQFFPDDLAANRLYRLNMRELASVANQLGRDKTMVESSGAGGYSISYPTFKACEDLLLAHGVNVMNPHLSHVSLAGMRQYEWPQTLTDHSSWFRWYRRHADHVARTAALLSQGREQNRVLLLHPTTTLWMHYSHPAFSDGRVSPGDRRKEIAEKHFRTFFALTDRQVDFDLGDETILAELGRARAHRLAVGERLYDLVVVPDAMENWTEATLRLMREYLEKGGRIIKEGAGAPTHVDGRPSHAPAVLQKEFTGQWEAVADAGELAARVAAVIPPRLSARDGSSLPEGLAWRRAALPGGDALWFFCNPWNRTIETAVRLPGAELVELDTASGEMHALPAERDGAALIFPLTFYPRGHALWLARKKAARDLPAARTPGKGPAISLGSPRVTLVRPNQLLVDYCDIETGGVQLSGTTTFRADDANWRVQGFPGSPWRSTQFNRNFVDHEVDPDSGFRVTYHFEVDDRLPAAKRSGLLLAVERPWLYTIEVNGRRKDFSTARRWFDEHMRALPVGRFLHSGENTVELVAARFDTLCEVKPIYILGDFALEPATKGFRVVPPMPLELGDWTRHGLPFYPHGVRYHWDFALDHQADGLRLGLGAWVGSVASVLLDDREVGSILHPPYALDIAGPVIKGRHEIAVEVVGNMRNMLGPHFSETHAVASAWQWGAPETTPPGEAYTLQPSGLFETPILVELTAGQPGSSPKASA